MSWTKLAHGNYAAACHLGAWRVMKDNTQFELRLSGSVVLKGRTVRELMSVANSITELMK